MFKLRMKTGYAAFDGNPNQEVTRILRCVARKIEDGANEGKCVDCNGNIVGEWKLTED